VGWSLRSPRLMVTRLAVWPTPGIGFSRVELIQIKMVLLAAIWGQKVAPRDSQGQREHSYESEAGRPREDAEGITDVVNRGSRPSR
jgi:hypothetical protein